MRDFRAPRRAVILSTVRWYLPDAVAAIALFAAVLGLLPLALAMAG